MVAVGRKAVYFLFFDSNSNLNLNSKFAGTFHGRVVVQLIGSHHSPASQCQHQPQGMISGVQEANYNNNHMEEDMQRGTAYMGDLLQPQQNMLVLVKMAIL